MAEESLESFLLASKSMLHLAGQRHTTLSAEQQANIQEAIEFIDRTLELDDGANV